MDSSAILTQADYILTAKGSYDVDATLSVLRAEKASEKLELRISVMDPLHRRILLEEPSVRSGESLLLNGDSFWIYLPKLRKSVRIPPQVAFAGEVSIADLGQPFFSMAYQPAGIERGEWDGAPTYILRLIPRYSSSPYAKVKLWVDRNDLRPLKVEYFGMRNVLLKTCSFEDYQEELGMRRPQRWVYQDAADPSHRTVLTMKSLERKNFDALIFDPQAGPELFNSPQPRSKSASGPTPRRRRAGSRLP